MNRCFIKLERSALRMYGQEKKDGWSGSQLEKFIIGIMISFHKLYWQHFQNWKLAIVWRGFCFKDIWRKIG